MKTYDRRLRPAGNSPSIKEIKMFVDDTIESLLQNHEVNKALARLKLADQQLVQATSAIAAKFSKILPLELKYIILQIVVLRVPTIHCCSLSIKKLC